MRAEGGHEGRSVDGARSTRSSSPPTPAMQCYACPSAGGGAEGGDTASPEGASALLTLDVNLAHNELHGFIEALYDEMDALRRQAQEAQEESKRVREEGERRQEVLACEADQRGADVTRLERELLDEKRRLQTLSSQHEELEAEHARLEADVAARDKTIADMKKLVEEASDKRAHARDSVDPTVLVSKEELQRAVNTFSRREQQVYGNIDYVRKASGGLQVVASEISTHISELRREISRLQQQHADYKTFIETHRCDAESSKRTDLQEVASAQVASVDSRARDERSDALEQRIASLEIERDALKLRCQSLDADVDRIRQELADATRVSTASRALIDKYEESSRDGTQTIDGLQESLLAICAQLEEERERHRRASEETAALAAEKERDMQAEIARLHDKLAMTDTARVEKETSVAIEVARADLRAALDAQGVQHGAITAQANESDSEHHRLNLQSQVASNNTDFGSVKRNPDSDVATARKNESSPHHPQRLQRVPASNSKRQRSENVEDIDDSDGGGKISLATTDPSRSSVTNDASKVSKRVPPLDPKAPCAGCRGEPFGFMVRCHKCKGQFHISCTKSVREATNSSHKRRHVFQCARCTPALQQRPSKVPRMNKAPPGT